MYLNEILPGNWREDEWPEHIEVSHESSRFKSRRYVPRVNSANKSSANPVDGIWCSHCGLVRSRRCSAAHLFPCTRCTHLTTCDRTTGADVYSTDADWCGEFEEA